MMWLVWRQQRFETILGVAVFGAVAVVLLLTGISMINNYQHLGVASCLTSSTVTCGAIRDAFNAQSSSIVGIIDWFNFVPLIFGIALGAPFIMELESGTYRLAWTQSITRERWLAARLLFVLVGALGLALALMALMHWWRGPIDHLESPFDPNAFDFEGPVIISYTIFASALILATGTLLRRTVPAIAVGIVGFLALRLGIENQIRMHYLTPVTASPVPRVWQRYIGWVLDSGWRTHSGSAADLRSVLNLCQTSQSKSLALDCIHQHGFVDYIVYQPNNRYWAFQGIESAIFLGVSALLVLLTVGWIRYRMR